MTTQYQHRGFVLVRSTTDPGDLPTPPVPGVSDLAVEDEGWVWLAKVWARDDAREALTIASPDLAVRIGELLADPRPGHARKRRRVVMSAASYLLRWQRRVTPFGLFAGVVPATIGPASGHIGRGHRAVARADAGWVAALAQRLEQDPLVRDRLAVMADSTAVIRDGRLIVSSRADPAVRRPARAREVSVRWTRPVWAAVEMAASPVGYAELASRLAAQFPAVAPDTIRSMLNGLLDGGFLITSLRPVTSAVDPVAHLIKALAAVGAVQIPGVAPVLRELERIGAQIRAHNACADTAKSAALRAEVAGRMSSLTSISGHPLAMDVRLDGHIGIPRQVLEEATAAADVLLRLTTRPFGSAAWLDYHARFRERYGPGALISVRELVAESGLGYPDGYSGTSARPAWRTLTERDAALLSLIQQATLSGTREICLTEEDIQALTIGDHVDLVPPTRVELGVTLHARSLAAIDRGDFELRVVAAPRIPTSMAGRFAHLLTCEERDLLTASYEAREGSVTVQMSFPPRLPHNENVVRVPPLVSDVLSLGEHSGGRGTIGVDDLAVTADAAQMYLVQRSTGRRVIPRIPHALDMTVRTPPLARFIAEVAEARSAGFGPFDPGAARTLPYLPRFRYRRTVLAAARWLLSRHDLPTAVNGHAWKDRLESWRRRWRVPARVIVCNGELRLPLDLTHPLDLGLLRAQLERTGRLELREDGPADGDGWLGRPAELLIPFVLASPPPRPLPVMAAPGRVLRPGAATLVCGQFAGSPERFDDVLSLHLPRLVVRLSGLVERWWVRRYRNMIRPWSPQHLAVYLRLIDRDAFARAASELAAFAAELDVLGLPAQLSLTSSYEQPGRYGHGDALSAAEQVFATDTAAAAAQITVAATAGVPGQAMAAASMAQMAAAFAPDPAIGYLALTRCLKRTGGPLDRAAHDLACQLVDPARNFTALRTMPSGEAVATAWARRDAALAAYREILSAQRDPGTLLRTLLHEHHMRALGLDPDLEKQTGRLARAAALRHLALAG